MEEEFIYTVGNQNRVPQIQDENPTPEEEIFITSVGNQEETPTEENPEVPPVESEESNIDTEESEDSQESEEEENENSSEENTETQEPDPFEDYSVSAIYAERLKEIDFLPADFETKKDLDHVEFLDTLIKKSEETGLKNAEAALIEKYGGEEVLKAAQFLNSGGDPVLLNKRSALDHFISLDLEDESNQEKVVRFNYKMKGIADEEAELFIETIKERGELSSKASKSVNELLTVKSNYSKQIETPPQPDNSQQFVAERNDKINGIISSSKVGPFKLDTSEQKKLQDFIMKPAYATQVNVNGVIKNKFITGLERAYQRLHSDLDKQVLLAKLLMDDFNLNVVKEQGKDEATASVLDHLNRKKSSKTNKTNSKKKINPYYG